MASTSILLPTSDFVATTLNGALAAAATSATIGTGLDIPATCGVLQINYDSTTAVGSDDGPETIFYATYNSGTGALAGMVRGLNGTFDVAHSNGKKVSSGLSVSHLKEFCGARAYAGGNTSVPNITATDIALNTESYDVGANFASNKFTAPVNGYYAVVGSCLWTSAQVSKHYATYLTTDSGIVCSSNINSGAVLTSSFNTVAKDIIYLAAGSWVKMQGYCNDGAGGIVGASAVGTYLSVALLKEV